MSDVAGRQHHLDDQQATGWVHRLTNMAKDCQTPILVPVMDDVREDISIRPAGDACEEVPRFNRYPIADTLGLKQAGGILHNVRPIEQYAARFGMQG